MKYYLYLILTICGLSASTATLSQDINAIPIQNKIAALEADSEARLGISAINTANNMRIEYRSEQRFPFQSTFKVIVASAILKQSTSDANLLEERIHYKESDLVPWSPITEKYLTEGMSVFDLSAAALMYSDNTATNLLVKKLGGIEAVTKYARSLGNNTFRLDNWESNLNSDPNAVEDTSTPLEMRETLQKIVLGNALAPKQQELLNNWLKSNTTGDNRIRAGVPKGWVVGDKTGGGSYGMTNDIGVIWPPGCEPIVIAIFLVNETKDAPKREDIVASATRSIIDEYAKHDQCLKQGENS